MIILINVFTVDPANQHRLLELLARATDEFVSRAPGFVSSTLHRSLDGTKVTMYAQWRSTEDYESMRRDPGPLPFLEESLTFAKFEPGMYEIVRTFSPTDGYSIHSGCCNVTTLVAAHGAANAPVQHVARRVWSPADDAWRNRHRRAVLERD
jgi:quinol monooxygenase YgiN